MKRSLFSLAALFAVFFVSAQSSKAVEWTYTAKKIAEKTYEVHFSANISGDYHLYAQDAGGEGPVPTAFTFTPNPLLVLNGKIKEAGSLVSKYEKAWKHDVKYYEKTVDFIQVVKLKSNVKTSLSGKVEFMVCDDHQCLPPADVEIKVNVGD